jgi:lipid-A-disaccharide synthase
MSRCFAMVAGEASGDILGAGLIKALKVKYPDAKFVGIGGPKMIAQGFETLYSMERLSVMGLVEVLGRLAELLNIRRKLFKTIKDMKPDAFIGIDAPDFNLSLERKLKDSGIKTVHYVSPSIWAWREKRVFKVKKAVDFYAKYDVPAIFVGHTLADAIDLEPDTAAARAVLDIKNDVPVVALLPGSREGEVSRLGELFLQTAHIVQKAVPNVQFVVPAANEARKHQLQDILSNFENIHVTLLNGQSREAMCASDVVLMASGTAALEGMLFKKPLVVSYRFAAISAFFLFRMLRQPYVSLPNLLAGKELIPELLQENATAEKLSKAVLKYLQDENASKHLHDEFLEIHKSLRLNADQCSAEAISELI